MTPELVLPILLNELDQLKQDFVLVLDDYHHIADSSIHRLLWGCSHTRRGRCILC